MKTQTLVLFGIILGFLCFGYTQFAGKGDQNAELGFAVSKIQALKKELEGANTASSKFQEESMRMKHEADAVRESKTSLEVEIGPLRILQVEQQKAASELEEAKSEIKKLNKKLQDTETLVDQEKLVSKKSEDALEDLWVTHNSTKENLRILMSGVSADTRKQSECEAKTSELERSLGTAHTVQTKLNAEVQSEAERAKDFEDKYFAVKSDLAVVAKENAFLKNRIEIFEAEADRHVLKGDRQTRRKNLIEEEKQRALNRALDPDLAKPIEAVTWNIAAVNNNPFEYWISGTEEYNKLMDNVANFITSPGELDIPVSKVFTQDMWEDLKQTMKQIGWEGVDKVGTLWEENYKGRRIISELMKDASIGKKRLASMPDRVTNTIVTTTGLAMRPTVINCYEGSIAQMDKWWSAWKKFMFSRELEVIGRRKKREKKFGYELLKSIKRAKYPAVTEEEEAISLPLQTLVGAIFDAILVHIMNHAAPNVWEDIRAEMCDKLNKGKNDRVVGIIANTYNTANAVFLQEVSGDFEKAVKKSEILDTFEVYLSEKADDARNQNSVILLSKGTYKHIEEVTELIVQEMPPGTVANGDLLAITCETREGVPYLFASFHGDTNGLATIPVVEAMHKYASSLTMPHKLVFGMDANTYQHPSPDQQGLESFAKFYVSKNLTTCYGDNPNPANYTTFHARTHLQTQLNKAVAIKDRDELGDKNPKDNIMFFKKDFVTVSTTKDNTGEKLYKEGMVFPTLTFPSDHGITSTVMKYPSQADIRKLEQAKNNEKVAKTRSFMEVVSWNVASMTENPFEYWMSGSESYNKIMDNVASLLVSPSDFNVPVKKVFTQDMWEELRSAMKATGWKGIDEVTSIWEGYREKRIITGILLDRTLIDKKLIIGFDQMTNTLNHGDEVLMRPSVINCYEGSLESTEKWWSAWKNFTFKNEFGGMAPWQRLAHLKSENIPALTAEEEQVSQPLQTMLGAIYDAVLVHLMNHVAPTAWETLRTEMCNDLLKTRIKRVASILSTSYSAADVVLLQDAPADFVKFVKSSPIPDYFDVYSPERQGSANSVIFLRKGKFENVAEATSDVARHLSPLAREALLDGELLAVTATGLTSGEKYLLTSFRATAQRNILLSVQDAIKKHADQNHIKHHILGAETAALENPTAGDIDMSAITAYIAENGLGTSFGPRPDPMNVTMLTGRTYLQPRTNKALQYKEISSKGESGLKDLIFFPYSHFSSVLTTKDNTGRRVFAEETIFPTAEFPSMHSITSTILQHKARPALPAANSSDISTATWNIAAVNNNPFEYWISGTEEYNKLMDNVANFITSPGELDIPVSKVFTQDMWEDLKQTMKQIGWEGVDKVGTLWEENYKGRRIISELMKDASIGKKRLASMPDRVTNTIVTTTGLAMRPTVINCYEGSIAQMDKWWSAWKNFMFHTTVSVPSKGSAKSLLVAKLLKPIKRAKYPAVTEEEEAISLPLQTLVGAIFDAILVHIMNHAASNGWERIRAEMCDKLNLNKEVNLAEIINRSYYTSDVLFLQEVGSGLLKIPLLSSDFTIRKPEKWDSARNQNSVILLRKHEWSHVKEVTTRVMQHIAGSAPVADGDLFVLAASRIENGVPVRYLFASFHGDTNGLATIPVVEAVHKYASSLTPHHKLVFGMDANTYQHPSPDQQGLEDFAKFYVSKNLTTCYGDNPNPANYTTFHARTHLQTQLNKAVAIKDRDELGDKNPKDNIMFFKKDFVTVSTTKDNTGNRRYEEGMVFPTLAFPSDHGITSTVLRPNEAKKKKLSMVSWDTSPIMHALDYPAHELPDYDTMEEEWKKGITATTLVNTILTSEMVEELRTKVGAMHWDVSNVDHTWESIKSNTIAEFYERRKRCGVADSVTRQVGEKRRPSVLTCTSGGWKEWLEYMFTAGEDNVVPARLIKNSEKGTKEAKIVKLAALDLVWGHLHGTLDQEKLKKLKKNLCKTYSAQDRVMWALDKFKAANFVALQGVGKNDVVPQLYDKYDVGGRCMVLLKKGVFKNVEKVSLKQNITALSVVYKETGLLLTSIDSMWKADTLVNYALNNQLLLVFGARDAVLDAVTQDLTAHTSNPSEKSIFSTGIVEPPSGIFSYNPLVETDSYDTTALQLPSHHQLLAAKVVL